MGGPWYTAKSGILLAMETHTALPYLRSGRSDRTDAGTPRLLAPLTDVVRVKDLDPPDVDFGNLGSRWFPAPRRG